MTGCCTTTEKANDLINKRAAWLLWYIPAAAVLAGSFWAQARAWLWVPAFVVMGAGCLANAARCGRFHCYVTGPLFLLAAVFVALSAFGIVALHPGLFLLVVFGACCLAMCAEIPLGRYRKS